MSKKIAKKIVIVGAGFGGLYTYLKLKKLSLIDNLEITLINKNNYFLFTPLLHEVATGSLGHHNVVETLRKLVKNSREFLQAEVSEIDLEKQKVLAEGLNGEVVLDYDYLVIATGSENNFYGIKGAKENSLAMKDLRDAIEIRNHLINQFELAANLKDEKLKAELLSFAVVGGGATGVEMVAEMQDLFEQMIKKYYGGKISCADISLKLVNRADRILTMCDQSLSEKAAEILEKRKVEVLNDQIVVEVDEHGLMLENGEKILAKTVIWAAGVKPLLPKIVGSYLADDSGRLKVNKYLQLMNFENVFAIGDAAYFEDSKGRALPMLAQVAARQSNVLAVNILALINKNSLKEFNYKSKGTMLSLGKGQAIADLGFVRFTGPLAWFMWRTVYFFNFASWSKRFKIGIDWFVNLFSSRDITKL